MKRVVDEKEKVVRIVKRFIVDLKDCIHPDVLDLVSAEEIVKNVESAIRDFKLLCPTMKGE